MNVAHRVPMTPDSAVMWRANRQDNGWFYHAEDLGEMTAQGVQDAMDSPDAEFIDFGSSARVFRLGNVVIKNFGSHAADFPMLNGRFENLRMNVAVSHALKTARLAVGDTRWRLTGVDYYGAIIGDGPAVPAKWAMQFVDHLTLREARRVCPDLVRDLHWRKLANTFDQAVEPTGLLDIIHTDINDGNYLVPAASLLAAKQNEETELEIVRIDVGSNE